MNKKEFYIGWQPAAPKGYAKLMRNVFLFLLTAGLILGLVLGIFQKKFSTASFEFGKLTELEGVYFQSPLPMLKVPGQPDLLGNRSIVTIPLVGFGKFGAAGIVENYEIQTGKKLDGQTIRLKGTLLYNDGKLLMQIDSNDHPFRLPDSNEKINLSSENRDLGMVTLKGEIVDPKCYFGVMKPGQGKAHKDCAIRCILGGIPPVLRTQNEKGEINYYLLTLNGRTDIGQKIKNYIGEPVSITAKAQQADDWILLEMNSDTAIQAISLRNFYIKDDRTASCGVSCTQPLAIAEKQPVE